MRHEMSVVVDRPIDEVWAFVSDPFNIPRLRGVTLGWRRTSPGPLGLGSTFQVTGAILGSEGQIGAAITAWEPPHTFTFTLSACGGLSGAVMRSGSIPQRLEAIAGGTRVTRIWEMEWRPIGKLIFWVYGPFWRRRMATLTQNTKRLLEAGRGAPGGSIDAP